MLKSLWKACPWTLVLAIGMGLLNLGLIAPGVSFLNELPEQLEYDRLQIATGEIGRGLSGQLVHWSWQHALLDVGAFVAVGWLYERRFRENFARRGGSSRLVYPAALLVGALAVAAALWIREPELIRYRGFSGINSAQFAAVLVLELGEALRDRRRLLWVAPAAGLFAWKVVSECLTGQMFFGTEALGDIGLPMPTAHAAGSLAGALCVLGLYAAFKPERGWAGWFATLDRAARRQRSATAGSNPGLSVCR